jgi:hypothetical protein
MFGGMTVAAVMIGFGLSADLTRRFTNCVITFHCSGHGARPPCGVENATFSSTKTTSSCLAALSWHRADRRHRIKMNKVSRPKEGVMSFRGVAVLGALSALSLVAVASIAAQAPETIPSVAPIVVSGDDVGFRIEGHRGQTPVGKIVVRIDGQWIEAALSQLSKPLIGVPLTERPATPLMPGRRKP